MPVEEDLPNQQTEESPETPPANMEVHHHPDLHHEKKKWKEYFLEFLMIFLAVTLGFIAENIRESISEHERAKVYAASMLKDLEEDTAQLKHYRAYFDMAAKNVDTLMQMLGERDLKDIPSGKLYWYGLWGGAHGYFIPNDATFQQMKSSGSLRYFEKTIAYDAANYDRLCRMMQTTESTLSAIYAEVRKSRANFFEFRYNDLANNIVQANWKSFDQGKIDSFIRSNPPMLSYDKTMFNQYIELVRSRFMHSNVSLADSLLKQSGKLILELEKKYDLDNE
ncbi:MAG TPA: hypothetical protein VK711_02045 [Puia sp.]|nr:hypothetical protein [Puia sp.]